MPRSIDEIRKRLAAKQLVAVVGAGVSVAASGDAPCASWRGLLADGLRHSEEFGSPPLRDESLELCERMAASDEVDLLLAAASVIEWRLGAPRGAEWRRWLKDAIGSLTLKKPELVDAVRGLDVPIVTTNYDSLLHHTPSIELVGPVTWRNTPAWVDILAGERPGILHLHGWWDEPESVVFGMRSYDEVLKAAAAQEIQRALGRFNTLLLVGYGDGIDDPNFRPLLRWLADIDAPNQRHYILLRSDQVKDFDHPGLHPVEYGPTFEFLPRFLRELATDSFGPATTSVRRDIVSLVDPGETFSESDTPPSPRMVVLAPGRFVMGSVDPTDEARREELPSHEVTLAYSFAVSQAPITFDDWDAFAASLGMPLQPRQDAGWGRGQRPVINVSWYEALEYVEWLNSLSYIEGTYRLLSEAEWEYAARAGTTECRWWGDDIDPSRANYDETRQEQTTQVGTYPRNPFGLEDMLGNVWEWTQDAYSPSYDHAPSDGSPRTSGSEKRVIRGGCWYYDASFISASARLGIDPAIRFNSIGFRIARTIRQPLRNHEHYALISIGSGLAATRLASGLVCQRAYAALPEQRWKLVEFDEAVFTVNDPSGGGVLSVAEPIDRNMSAVVVEPPTAGLVQRWEAVPEGDGYLFVNAASGKVLDVDGISLEDGTRIIQFARHGNANQRWWARPAP